MHEMAVADNDRLTSQCETRKSGQENRRFGQILERRKLAIHGCSQHHVLDDLFFSNAKLTRLLGNLFFDQSGSNKTGGDQVGANLVFRSFFRHRLRKTAERVFRCDVSALVGRSDVGMN